MQTILHTLFLEYLQMKARIVYLATLMMAMLAIMSACNNDDFPEISEGLKDNSVVIKSLSTTISQDADLSYQTWWGDYESNYECFRTLEELENSPYASTIDELPNVDWKKQTLVIAYIYDNYIFIEEECNVYGKSDKYTIEYKLCPSFAAAFDCKGIAIVLNKPNIKKKDVNFKISIYGHDYEY